MDDAELLRQAGRIVREAGARLSRPAVRTLTSASGWTQMLYRPAFISRASASKVSISCSKQVRMQPYCTA